MVQFQKVIFGCLTLETNVSDIDNLTEVWRPNVPCGVEMLARNHPSIFSQYGAMIEQWNSQSSTLKFKFKDMHDLTEN